LNPPFPGCHPNISDYGRVDNDSIATGISKECPPSGLMFLQLDEFKENGYKRKVGCMS